MKILNIHGYHGDTQNSAYKALSELGCDTISPAFDYDNELPGKVMSNLRDIIDDNNIEMIVGTSLGGFYAAVLSARTGLPAILVNPCLLPFLHLPRLGYNGNIASFVPLFGELSELYAEKISVIIGGSDEVIDTHDFTKNLLRGSRFRVVTEGKHSGSTLPLKDFFGEILRGDIPCVFS